MKKIFSLFLILIMIVVCSACAAPSEEAPLNEEPQISQVQSICELAVMDCYYHNVAKFSEKDAQGALWWKKDKHFWIEYSGIVTLGVDASLVTIEVNDTQVTITLPEAKILDCKIDSTSLTEDSYIFDKDSADIEAIDEVAAIAAAQDNMEKTAANDKTLLCSAQQRTKELLEGYVNNIGNAVGKEYTIEWVYTDANGNPLNNTPATSQVSQ